MNLTNKTELPQAIVDAVRNDPYTSGGADISVTSLIGPPRKSALYALHAQEITEDASERIWSLLGQSIHTILERANKTGIAERRLSIEIGGWTVSGGMDLYEEGGGILADYKTTSAWSVKQGVKDEWVEQLNCYAEILRSHNQPVTGLRIIAILRDWSKMEAARDPFYPRSQVVSFSLPLWPSKDTRRFLEERVTLHRQARVSLPLCTDEERWAKKPVYAVMKVGGTRAVKLYDLKDQAETHAAQDKGLIVQYRPGDSTRCRFYCSVLPFCEQGKGIIEGKAKA